jgi:uncharacterized protein (DUF4415 family)
LISLRVLPNDLVQLNRAASGGWQQRVSDFLRDDTSEEE